MAKEVFGNVLARAFDLSVPEIALIRFSEPFVSTLLPDLRHDYASRPAGLYFGSEYIPDTQIYSTAIPRRHWEDYETATIFAFDSLIFNTDRGGYREKPNLLVTDHEFYLIDHELAFAFADQPTNVGLPTLINFLEDSWLYPASKHLFFPHLHKLSTARRQLLFAEFREFLRYLPIGILDEPALVLRNNGVAMGDISLLRRYLETVKQHPGRFIQTLRNSLA